jgi:aminopeptidase N
VVDAAERWAGDGRRPSLQAEVAAACRRLAEVPDRRRVALRTLARVAPDLDQVRELQEAAASDVDLQWRALVRAAELGADTGPDVERLLALDPDPEAHVRALTVTAATPSTEAKQAAWTALVVDRSVPVGQVDRVTAAFWRPGQDALLAPYAERYLDLLPSLHRGGMISAMVYSSALFPVHGAGEPFLQRLQEAAPAAEAVVRKRVLEEADLLRRVLRSRGAGR